MTDPIAPRDPAVSSHHFDATDAVAPSDAVESTEPLEHHSSVEGPSAEEERAFAGEKTTVEKKVFELAQKLAPGEVAELELGGKVTDGLHLSGSGKVKIEREHDGSFSVELEGKGAVGVGIDPGAYAEEIKAGFSASAAVTVEAGTKLHFKTPEALADFVDASSGAQMKVAGTGVGWVLEKLAEAGGVVGKDPTSRLAHYFANNTAKVSVAGGVTAAAGFALEVEAAKFGVGMEANLRGTAKTTYTYDVERGVLRQTQSVSGKVGGKAGLGAFSELSEKGTLSLEREVRFPRERVRELLSGHAEQFFNDVSKMTTRTYLTHEGIGTVATVGGASYTFSSKTELGGEGKTEVEYEASEVGNTWALAGGVAGVEGEVVAKRSRKFEGSSLEECRRKAAETANHEQALTNARAQSRLRD